ncbi:hypothetical protein L6164_012912 [Bauhinia variegata]|uniref:Uncharacterized protein n=1 Tax=Bauhinia variegata TaxID=167791 RepID=A0ACB9PAQ0_BAUVA|nr:hypothetical protein L6164_012912 [Bauhinia variegata]
MANNHRNFIQYLPHNNTFPIECRFCNQVISTNAALISHMEFHIQQQEMALGIQDSQHQITYQREPIANNFSSIVPASRPIVAPPKSPEMFPARTNSFLRATQFFSLTLMQDVQPAHDQISSLVQSTLIPQVSLREMEVYPTDGTKPLIQMLEHPIMNIEFIDLVEDDHELDLKL